MKAVTISNKNIEKILKRAIKILSKPQPITYFCGKCFFYHEVDYKCIDK